jgi:hypothetical protein
MMTVMMVVDVMMMIRHVSITESVRGVTRIATIASSVSSIKKSRD